MEDMNLNEEMPKAEDEKVEQATVNEAPIVEEKKEAKPKWKAVLRSAEYLPLEGELQDGE